MDIRGLEGSIVALVTPFAEDGSIDFDALGRLGEHSARLREDRSGGRAVHEPGAGLLLQEADVL
mgnify:FL=1